MIRERIQPTERSDEDNDTPFIGLTVCPAYNSAYKEDVLEEYGLTKKEYRNSGDYLPKDRKRYNDTWENPGTEIFNQVTHGISDILRELVIQTRNVNTSRFILNFNGGDDSEYVDVVTKHWPSFGRCYSIIPKKCIVEQGITRIVAKARISIYIYLGYPGQFMHSNSKTKVSIL